MNPIRVELIESSPFRLRFDANIGPHDDQSRLQAAIVAALEPYVGEPICESTIREIEIAIRRIFEKIDMTINVNTENEHEPDQATTD